ncbi:MAG: hypothetical protein ACRERE_29460 [Candidatus Entotheonellia bacterium]
MPVHTCHAPAKERVRSAGPTPVARTCQEQPLLALFTTDHDAAREDRRATPEEIDQVFVVQLAARPHSVFLREVVADRARRRLTGEGVEHAGVDVLLSAFVERVKPGQRGAGRREGGGETVTNGERAR